MVIDVGSAKTWRNLRKKNVCEHFHHKTRKFIKNLTSNSEINVKGSIPNFFVPSNTGKKNV